MKTDLKHFNAEALTEIVALEESGEAGLLRGLIEEYEKSFEPNTQNIRDAFSKRDFPNLELYAHSLKSSSRLLGLEVLAEIFADIEEEAREGRADENKQTEFKKEFELAFPQLNGFKKAS